MQSRQEHFGARFLRLNDKLLPVFLAGIDEFSGSWCLGHQYVTKMGGHAKYPEHGVVSTSNHTVQCLQGQGRIPLEHCSGAVHKKGFVEHTQLIANQAVCEFAPAEAGQLIQHG